MTRLTFKDLSKRYHRTFIFNQLSEELIQGDILSVIGHNGSGKSTFLKTVAQILPPTKGVLEYSVFGKLLSKDIALSYSAFIAPYTQVFTELTPYQNLKIILDAHQIHFTELGLKKELERFQLKGKLHVPVRHFSSGMQQRVKLLCGMIINPVFLFLDEPTSNLDTFGKALVKECIEEQKKRGITILCTNEPTEIEWGNKQLDVSKSV